MAKLGRREGQFVFEWVRCPGRRVLTLCTQRAVTSTNWHPDGCLQLSLQGTYKEDTAIPLSSALFVRHPPVLYREIQRTVQSTLLARPVDFLVSLLAFNFNGAIGTTVSKPKD